MSELTRRSFLKKAAVATVGGSVLLTNNGITALAEDKKTPLKVRAAVFSPTGGTMNAAYLLASMLTDTPDMIDQTALSTRGQEIRFAADELAIWAAPSYAGKIPYVPDLFLNLKGDHTPCVLVCAYGNRACENNFAQMHQIATEQGFIPIGAISIVTPHTFGARAGRNRPDLQDHETIKAFADQIADKMASGNLTPIAVEGDPARGEKFESSTEKKLDTALCIHCGTCTENCPVGAIDAETLAIDPALCIHCQRCTYVCPAGARSFAANWDGTDGKYFSPRKAVAYIV